MLSKELERLYQEDYEEYKARLDKLIKEAEEATGYSFITSDNIEIKPCSNEEEKYMEYDDDDDIMDMCYIANDEENRLDVYVRTSNGIKKVPYTTK